MKHTWESLPSEQSSFGIWFKNWKCKVCGCLKSQGCYKFSKPDYQRSGINYDYCVECIDEKAEMLKTID